MSNTFTIDTAAAMGQGPACTSNAMNSAKTQEEYEKQFDIQSIREQIEIEASEFINEIIDSDLSRFYKLFNNQESAWDVLLHILVTVGSPLNDRRKFIDKRVMDFVATSKAIAKTKLLSEIKDYGQRIEFSMHLLDSLDGVLYDLSETVDGVVLTSYINFEVSADLSQVCRGAMLPLIEPPKKWKEGISGGYHTTGKKVTLNRGERDQPQNVLDILNKLQENKWRIADGNDMWKYKSFMKESMMKKGAREDIAEKVSMNKSWTANNAWAACQDKDLWFEWRYDMRGRAYNTGYDVHLQSDKYQKGAIVPLNAQKLTVHGAAWLKVDLANSWGDDKISFRERANGIAAYMLGKEDDAESPTQFRNAKEAIRKSVKGEEVSHCTYLDASNQALQLYAVETGDLRTAMLCNLANGNDIADAYQVLANGLNEEFNTRIFTRTFCKKALMTTMYGKVDAASEVLKAMYPGIFYVDALKELSKDLEIMTADEPEESEFYIGFRKVLYKIAPLAMQTMELIQSLNRGYIDTYTWELPDGFKVKYDVKSNQQHTIDMRLQSSKLHVRTTLSHKVYQGSDMNRGLPANIIHSIDGYVVRRVVQKMEGRWITTIFDAFGVHPNDVTHLRKVYREVMIELLESNTLQTILHQIADRNNLQRVYLPVKGKLTRDHIIKSQYMLG